jgi:hypothetical protein
MFIRGTGIGGLIACSFLLLSPSLGAQSANGSCMTEPLDLALIFDQSLSTPTDSARNAYRDILSAVHSSLQPGDRLLVFRLPDSTETEVELVRPVDVRRGEAIAAETIVDDLLRRPTQHSDLSKAVGSIVARFDGSSCRVVVLVTDGSLSPSQKPSAGLTANAISRIAADFRSSVATAQEHVALYAFGYRSDQRLAIDSTYWPKSVRIPVRDGYWGLDLATLRGDAHLQRVFGGRFFPDSPGSISELLFFSEQAVFRSRRGYRPGIPSHNEQMADVYFRVTGSNCHTWNLRELYPDVREINTMHDRCVFHSVNPPPKLVEWLKSLSALGGVAVVYRPAQLYTFDAISPDVPFRHGFVIGSNSRACTNQTLLTYLAANGVWPPSSASSTNVFVSWRSESVDMLKDDSLALIDDTQCLALYDLFTAFPERTVPVRSLLFSGQGSSAEGPILQEWFRRYPANDVVVSRTILNRRIWWIRGHLALSDGQKEEIRLFVKGVAFDLLPTASSRCRLRGFSPDDAVCYKVNARFTAPENVQVGVVVPDGKRLDTCLAECFPIKIRLVKPWLRLAQVLLGSLVIAFFLELYLEGKWPWLRRLIEKRIGKRERTGPNVVLNVALTTAWLALACVVAGAAITPGAGLLTLGAQVFLAIVGAGLMISLFDATIDIASSLLIP